MNGNRQRIIVSLIFIILFIFLFRLLQLQIFTNEYKLLAEKNIVQENTIFPSRGIIYDRKNNIIVENQPVYDLLIVPKELKLLCVQIGKLFRSILESTVNRFSDNYVYCKSFGTIAFNLSFQEQV